MNRFADRTSAGRELGTLLIHYRGRSDVVVLALPRGGVPVAFEVAHMLDAPLDVIVVRKLGAPGAPEFALGAISSGGVTVMNAEDMEPPRHLRQLADEIAGQQTELRRRELLYRQDRQPVPVRGMTCILVDDGAATGASMRAAVRAVRELGAGRIVAALPVASVTALALLRNEADEVVCTIPPPYLVSVSEWYRDFSQTADREVLELLDRARNRLQHPLSSAGHS
ncbi:phosphoribosyltransferase [Povalibacter sp.]|uniref:phosphoribosyltransferase n=1 Tax=Povalibacter sp. TaxID=1962978 RepID=UPI002F40AD53